MRKKLLTSISLIIPVYNNESTLYKNIVESYRIAEKLTNSFEIVICNDASTDNTTDILEEKFKKNENFKIITHKKNQGIAKTIRKLYKKAKYSYIVLFSADGDWKANDIEKMLKAAHKYNADIVIGKRKNVNYSIYRKVISFSYNFLPKILFRVDTIDAGSNKVIKKKVIDKINIQSKSVFFEAEIIIKASKLGFRIISIPIYYHKKNDKKGKGGDFKYVFNSLIDIVKLRSNYKI